MRPDNQIKKDILDELDWDPEIDASQVGVVVKDCAVTVFGHVETYRQKIAVQDVVKRVADVHAVVNNIDVQLASRHRMTDDGLAERISHVLEWNVSSANRDITADVKHGVVTLSGELEWGYERSNILRNIQHVSGVVNVIDEMTIIPRASATDVQTRIKSALQRHVQIEAHKIKVATTGGIVRLTGTVDSIAERERVDDAAWSAPGVSRVVNELQIA